MIEKFKSYLSYVTPSGRAETVKILRQYKQTYGERFLEEFKAANPDFVFFVDIIANYPQEEAFEELKKFVAALIENQEFEANIFCSAETMKKLALDGAKIFLENSKLDIYQTHAELRAEIDKPRF